MLAFLNLGTTESIIILLVSFVIPIAIFLILRQLMLWYWRVNEMLEIQKQQSSLMQRQVQLLEEQNALLRAEKGNRQL